MPCQNPSWIMSSRIFREEEPRFLTRSKIGLVYTDIKMANITKINHKMVSFTDHYNTISLGRLPPKTKIGKY